MNYTGGTLFRIFDKLNLLYMRDVLGEIHLKEVDEHGNMKTVMQSKNELSEDSKQILGVANNF